MAKSKLSEIFIRRVDEIAAQLDGAKSAVFFQGLTPYMFRELAGHPSAVWGLADAIDSNGCLGLDLLAQLKKSAFGCLMNEDGPVLLPYEVLIDLRGAVGELYEGNIVVVRNNLFDDMGGLSFAGFSRGARRGCSRIGRVAQGRHCRQVLCKRSTGR